jgi:hypothetical protein
VATIDCVCPPKAGGETRHPDGDTITFRERLDFLAALTVVDAFMVVWADDDSTAADVLAAMTQAYVFLGIESWTLADARGKPLPVTRANIREHLLSNVDAGFIVADEADELYAGTILPLALRTSSSSPDMPTEASTSRPTPRPSSTKAEAGSSPRRQRRSKPSSTSISRTDGIVTITPSLEPDSSSSLSSA